jgi:adenylyltransferase/sulfurtransferase
MLSDRERERYKRQILLFGEEGQERLSEAEVFIAGAGGLGSPVAIYLAVAGVGTLAVADPDVVDRTNLNRQVLHRDRDIGEKKVASAAEKLGELNPDIAIRAVDARIGEKNAGRLVGRADGIVDCLDNYPARYLLNRVALKKGIPLFHGAIRGMYGQATTLIPGKTPCLACIFPKPPPEETSPVVGVTPGLIGMVQANEVLKYLLGIGELLAGRLFLWDGLAGQATEICVERNPACAACGDGAERGKRKVRRR